MYVYCNKHVYNVKIYILWYTLFSKSEVTHMFFRAVLCPSRKNILLSPLAVKSTVFIFSCFSSFLSYLPVRRLFNEIATEKNEKIPFSMLNIFTRYTQFTPSPYICRIKCDCGKMRTAAVVGARVTTGTHHTGRIKSFLCDFLCSPYEKKQSRVVDCHTRLYTFLCPESSR